MAESDNLDKVSILIPTYNRPYLLPLVFMNLYHIDYPKDKLEVVFDDDGEVPMVPVELREQFSEQIGIRVKYVYNKEKRRTIGEKRNRLVKYATYNTCAFMDDDDMYNPYYIKHSVELMKEKKAGLVGSNSMIFCFVNDEFKLRAIRCAELYQIHEATMVFTKKYFRSMGGFNKSNQGEGAGFIQNRTEGIAVSDINKVMICLCWENNTINKNHFNDEKYAVPQEKLQDGEPKELLKKIMILKKSEDIV